MKLKLTQRTVTEKETDIDLPIYFNYQLESLDEEWVMWDGSVKTIVTKHWFGYTVQKYECTFPIEEYQLNSRCSMENFYIEMQSALEYFKK